MAILISYPHQIPDDKVESLVGATKKRFGDLLKKRDRIDRLVDRAVTSFNFTPSQAEQAFNIPSISFFFWHPSESRCSETLSLLYFSHFLGSPPELESSIAELREITRPLFQQVKRDWERWAAQSSNTRQDYVLWPFDQASNERLMAPLISGPEVWRAAYYDLISAILQRSFERRRKAAAELAGTKAESFLGVAMRDFARIHTRGRESDLEKRSLNVTKVDNQWKRPLLESLNTNFRTIDADSNGKITVSEYARFLSESKQQVESSTQRASQLSAEELQIADDFGNNAAIQTTEKDVQRQFQDLLHALAMCLTADRAAPISDSNLDQLAKAIVRSNSSIKTNLDSIKSAIRKSWPFKGVTSVLPGVPTEANWLLSDQETGYTLIVDPQAVLPSIRTLVDELAGEAGIFDEVVKGLAKDREGPRVDLRNLVQHLGNEMIFCAGTETHPVSIIAFSLKNAEGVQKELQNFNDSLDEMRIVKNYLVMGKKMDVDRVTARVITAPEVRASNNLKMLGLAFLNFESTYRKLPGSKNYREGGIGFKGPRAKHPFSWRVAILPFVEQAELFQQYDFNEPWDSEKNLKLLDKMPAVFRSPHAPSAQKVGETNYLGFAGEKSAMVDGGIPMAEIKDGTSATVLLVETKLTVPWTKPEDFAFAEYADAKRAEPFDGLGLNCLMVDGTVLSMDAPIDWERLGRLVTRDGGEPFTTKP